MVIKSVYFNSLFSIFGYELSFIFGSDTVTNLYNLNLWKTNSFMAMGHNFISPFSVNSLEDITIELLKSKFQKRLINYYNYYKGKDEAHIFILRDEQLNIFNEFCFDIPLNSLITYQSDKFVNRNYDIEGRKPYLTVLVLDFSKEK